MASAPTRAFSDGRQHVAELRIINGRKTQVIKAGIQGSPGPESGHAVPGSVFWIDIQPEFGVTPGSIGRSRKVLTSPASVRRTGNPIGATRRLLAC